MRKSVTYGIMVGIIAILAVGCKGNDSKNEGVSPTPTVSISEETPKIEPTLSEEAKKLTQFKELKKGDTVAEITIKDYGTITIKLFPKQAPKAVENFTTLAKQGYYDGLSFHRVIDEFMIQGGDPQGDGTGGSSIWGEPFEDEFTDELHPFRGALCMANSGANTNGSQFFIIDADANSVQELNDLITERYKDELTFSEYLEQGYGVTLTDKQIEKYLTYGGTPWLYEHHTVFGQMVDGFSVLDAVASVPVTKGSNAPKEAVIVESVKIYEYKDK